MRRRRGYRAVAVERAEQGAVTVGGDFGCLNVVLEIRLEVVMAGNFQHLAAFLKQAQPETAVGHEDVLHVHGKRS